MRILDTPARIYRHPKLGLVTLVERGLKPFSPCGRAEPIFLDSREHKGYCRDYAKAAEDVMLGDLVPADAELGLLMGTAWV